MGHVIAPPSPPRSVHLAGGEPRRADILAYFRERFSAGLPPPTVREICREVGIPTYSIVVYHLRILEQRGLLIRDGQDGASRRYRLAPRALLAEETWPLPAQLKAVVAEPGRVVFILDDVKAWDSRPWPVQRIQARTLARNGHA
jgi:DNA-binding transcriptional ArsR family regulator